MYFSVLYKTAVLLHWTYICIDEYLSRWYSIIDSQNIWLSMGSKWQDCRDQYRTGLWRNSHHKCLPSDERLCCRVTQETNQIACWTECPTMSTFQRPSHLRVNTTTIKALNGRCLPCLLLILSWSARKWNTDKMLISHLFDVGIFKKATRQSGHFKNKNSEHKQTDWITTTTTQCRL